MERTILRIRSTVEKTIGAEEVARRRGLLQAVPPMPKAVLFLLLLAGTSLATAPAPLLALFFSCLVAARLSQVPFRPLATQVLGTALFFGPVLALPVSLVAVTPGHAAFQLGRIGFSEPGLRMGGTILLRLVAGIALASLWCQTTRWHLMLASLKAIGTPRLFLSAAALTYRYVFVLLSALAEMVEARTSRQVQAVTNNEAREYAGSGTAILFAKSLALAEETHFAMQARGFDLGRRN